MTSRNAISFMSALLITAVICAPAHAGGRPGGSSRSWFGHINTGWTFPSGDTGDVLDDDWRIGGGAMYWPSDWPIGIGFDIDYWQMDLSNSAIQAINDAIDQDPMNDGDITGGDVDNWQFAVNGIWSIGKDTSSGLYLTGGISWNSITGRVTETGIVYYPPICDPWYWWWCYPGGIGPGSIVVGKRSADEFGWNLGAGYSFDTYNGQFFIEARYQQIQVGNKNVEYFPLTFGFRW